MTQPKARENDTTILEALDSAGAPLTQGDLVETTGLSRRSIYTSLQRLIDAGCIRAKPNLRDTRTKLYAVAS